MSTIIKRAAEWALEEPLSEMIQDTFPLRNMQDQDVGTITMLVRLTCFGKTIITKFQIADNKKSFLFKNAKTQDYEFKCKKCMPGQPILRPRASLCEEEDEGNEAEAKPWNVTAYENEVNGLLDKEQNTEGYQDPCAGEKASAKEIFNQGPGFQRHEVSGKLNRRLLPVEEKTRKIVTNQFLNQVPGTRVHGKHGSGLPRGRR